MPRRRHVHLLVLIPLLTALGAASACGSSAPASPERIPVPDDSPGARAAAVTPIAGSPPRAGRPWYLAIGDSITFGFTLDSRRAGTNASWALQLEPLLAAAGRPWALYDVACPGERTDTYTTLCPNRALVPFLASRSQHDAALAAVDGHRADLRLILVDLGSNDLLRAFRDGAGPVAVGATLRRNLTAIVTELERTAPGVPVVLANFYNPLANSLPATQAELVLVNDVVAQVAAATNARLADFFAAINTTPIGHDPALCDYVDCAHADIHPTVLGQARLARAALAAIVAS